MADDRPLILGEHRRLLDERFRVSLPVEWLEGAFRPATVCILAKERVGALSLWNADVWQKRLDAAVGLIQTKINAGRLDDRITEVQHLGRMLSTRHRSVQLAGRGRLSIPEGFREFLGVEPGGDILLVGAAVCVEIWRTAAWLDYQQERMPEFGSMLDELSR